MFDKKLISSGVFCRGVYVPFDVENRNTPPFRSLDFYPDSCGIRIVQSCNGLLLCCSDKGTKRTRKYYVFNPTTKQFAVIPSVPGGPAVRKEICFMGLAFHPTDCADYKVVCIFRDGKVCRIQIYSSNIGKWKSSNQSFNAPSDTLLSELFEKLFTCGVYWNGAIHWAPACRDPLYFKLDIEQLQKLPLPLRIASSGGYQVGYIPLYFGESRGHLHLVEIAHHHGRHLVLDVYEMSSDHSGWFLKYQVELDGLLAAYPRTMIYNKRSVWGCFDDQLEVLDIIRGETEGGTFMVVKVVWPRLAIRYNFLNKSFKQLSGIPYSHEHSEAHRYIETIGSF
ncbi:F-box domain-containing protein [Artemisia annua]|uniref:F-box domain-containing protein n=1 Tax=Artemisia annua TaxID=35608 RepID=A0A2U1PQS7_ARTAN|nr:F-box domain-containing protein [Artemisia annua]